ncbi:beta strand repeat-containing protein [Luteolibacter sp. Populi]|uniref:beta strand repeat-containing protein n=1 Tax=Luteolibacter sp. Populi TaxID=3230487 RepID=UPI0034675EB4
MPGWAHTRWSFLKYDGANVLEIPNAEKILGNANLATATATSAYYDSGAGSTLGGSQAIGLVETSADFVIGTGFTLDIAKGGLMYHGGSHWVKGGGSVTSSSGQLTVVANGGQPDYQINGVFVKDSDTNTALSLVKTGPEPLGLSGVANTYTGGTWINNGRLRASNVASYGAASGIVKVLGANSQACLAAAGTFGNSFQIEGLGWTETAGKAGALRFEAASTINGSVTLTGASRMAVNPGVSGAITGALSGSTDLEIGYPAGTFTGTLNLNGSGTGMTGLVTVSTGRLNVNNGLGGSVTVAGGATLGGESTIAGDLTIGGATASNLGANGATPAVLAVTGAVDISAGTTNLAIAGVPVPAAPFAALTYGSLTGPTTNLTVTGLRGGTATDDTVNKQILVNFTPGTLNWTGTTNANWTQNADLNFDNGAATNFFNGDHVTFGESATAKTVTLVGMLYPSSVIFDHTSDYTVLGPNAGIGGATGLTKNGSGTLNVNGQASTFTGPVVVNAGRIKYGTHWEALGYNSGVTIAAGAQVDLNGSYLANVGRAYDWTIAGSGPDGLGAITNSGAGTPGEAAGIRTLTLAADAAIGGNGGRLDVGNGAGTGILNGNGHTLTKVGANPMGFRANAAGTPVNFVIAGGYAWAENTDNAWGGATGTLRIKNGTRAGTYGARTIATPVFLEAGSKLHNQGGGKGTWTATVTLEGDATVESDLGLIDLMGPVTGAFSLTKTGAQTAYLADAQYTGNTTVSAGVLSVGTATLGDSSTVSIATTAGTKLDLPHGGTDSVAVLLINGMPQPIGTYGSVASGADHPDDNRFSGNGMLNVTTGGSAYQSWAATHGIPGASGAVDSDNDGIPNGIEFVIGSDPSDSDSSALAPTLDDSNPAYIEFSYRRTDDSAGDDPYVQYGSDLTGWTTAQGGEPVANPVVINETFDAFGTGIDRVTVRIPRALAEDGALFARLRVDIP